MTKQTINVGTTANDKKGDSLRAAFQKVNANFTELYTALGLNADTTLNLGAFEFTGSTMTTTDSTPIVIDQSVTVSSDLTVGGDIVPSVANGGNLGSLAKPFNSLYVSNSTIYLGNNALRVDNSGEITINNNRLVQENGQYISLASNVTDVNLSSPANGDVLTWTGSYWTNAAGFAGTGDITFTNDTISSSTGSVNIETDTGVVWEFNDGGTLNFPGATASIYGFTNTLELFADTNSNNGIGVSSSETRVINSGSVLIVSDTDDNEYTWRFGADGSLEVPGDIRSESAINIDINLSDSTLRRWRFGEDGELSAPGDITTPGFINGDFFRGNTLQILDTGTITSHDYNGLPTMVVTGNVGNGLTIGANGNLINWLFDPSGNITLPRGYIKNDSVTGFLRLEGPVTADMVGDGMGYPTISNGVEILTHRVGDDLERKFRFSWDGALYMSTDSSNSQVGAIEWRNVGSATVQLKTSQGSGSQPDGLHILTYGTNTGTTIGAGFNKKWIFRDDGDLTIPGDIKSEGNINIDINLSDSTLRRWQFGEDGDLRIPGNITSNQSAGLNLNAGYSVNIVTDWGDNNRTWLFDGTSGTLELPADESSIIFSDGTEYLGTTVTMPTTPSGNTNSFVWEFSDNVIGSDTITLNWNLLASDQAAFYIGTTHSTNGKYLLLDGNAQSLNYVTGGIDGGGKILFGATAGNNAGDVNAIEIKGVDGDVYLTSTESVKITVDAADSSARVWRFDPSGDLTFPDNTSQTTAFTGNAETVDITDTNGLTTVYYPTFVENRTTGQYIRADVDFTYKTDDNLLTVGNVTTGILKIEDGVHEKFQAKADATGTVTHDCTSGHIFYHTSPDANWTANFTNLNLAAGYATTVTLVIVQGGTGYYPNALQIDGAAQTINWQGNTTPTVSTNRTDVVTFSILNNSGTYVVLGQITGF